MGATDSSYAQADENQHLKASMGLVDDTLKMIGDIRTEMLGQSDLLKRTKGQLLKFMNLTGFSSSIIRVISQRSKVDFIIFIIGCVLTLTIIFALWYFF